MTPFFIGMMAAGLWLAIMAILVYSRRSHPGAPSKSVESFANARRSLEAPAPGEEPAPVPPAEPDGRARTLDLDRFDVPASISEIAAAGAEEANEEVEEVEKLLASVTAPRKPRKPRNAPPRPAGPRKAGRQTYIVVDELGRPEQ